MPPIPKFGIGENSQKPEIQGFRIPELQSLVAAAEMQLAI